MRFIREKSLLFKSSRMRLYQTFSLSIPYLIKKEKTALTLIYWHVIDKSNRNNAQRYNVSNDLYPKTYHTDP